MGSQWTEGKSGDPAHTLGLTARAGSRVSREEGIGCGRGRGIMQ